MTKDSLFPANYSALALALVLCSHFCAVLSPQWSLMDKGEPFLTCSAGAHWNRYKHLLPLLLEARGDL